MYIRSRSAEVGRLEVVPSSVTVGRPERFELTYTAGTKGVCAGGQIRIRVPIGFSLPSTDMVQARGLVRLVSSTKAEVNMRIEPPIWWHDNWPCTEIVLSVHKGSIDYGERIELTYGAGLQKTATPNMACETFAFDALVDSDGSRSGPHNGFVFVESEAPVTTKPDEPCRMEIFIPSVISGNKVETLVVKKDAHHNYVSADRKTISLSDTGVIVSKDASSVRVELSDNQTWLIGRSNPAIQVKHDHPRIFWGDLHVHTAVHEAAAYAPGPERVLRFARDTIGLDFTAITDSVKYIRGDEWKKLIDLVGDFTEPGKFAAFAGFEFYSTEKAGHFLRRLDRNVIFRNPDVARLPMGMGCDDYGPQDSAALFDAVDFNDSLVIPHQHPGGDWQAPYRDRIRLVEIYSHWGAYERPDCERPFTLGRYNKGALVSEALQSGIRLGFVGSSDTHTGLPGNDFFWACGGYPGGLTAVWAKELSPRGIWQALHNRSCYATTRARIFVRFCVNGAPMGSEIRLADTKEPRKIEAEIHGTTQIDEINVIRNGQVFAAATPDSEDAFLDLVDEEPLTEHGYYYYLKVRQTDGNMAWASPVWVDL